MEEKKYYTYIHLNPDNNEVFYVGKGTGNRVYNKTRRSSEWKKYVRGLKNDFKAFIIKDNLTSKEAEDFEKILIARLSADNNGGRLVNSESSWGYTLLEDSLSCDSKGVSNQPKYYGWSKEKIITDLNHFPNMEEGLELEDRLEFLSFKLTPKLYEIAEYAEDLAQELELIWEDLETTTEEFKISAIDKKEFLDILFTLAEDLNELKEQVENDFSQPQVTTVLTLMEEEMKRIIKLNS